MEKIDLVVIGAGPAGLAAAISARDNGVESIVVLERAEKAGGILPQCVHNGFGLHRFKEELTGPEYAERYADEAKNIEIRLNTMVISVSTENGVKTITAMGRERGVTTIEAKSIIIATGCRERTRGAINISGTRPAGVLTAGAAQRLMNINGLMTGKKIVVLGSGDIGLIMARRLTLEGAKVLRVCEVMSKSSGLERNIAQCLNDFNIPLDLTTTVAEIHGKDRVEGVTLAKVDENLRIIPNTEEFVECDTVLLSVGLIPENELAQNAGVELAPNGGAKTDKYCQTNVQGIFACGNAVNVKDLVDFACFEGDEAGKNAALYVKNKNFEGKGFEYIKKEETDDTPLEENEKRLTCIVCPIGCRLRVFLDSDGKVKEVTNNKCKRGVVYAEEEFTAPKRTLTSTVLYELNGKKGRLPVKTNKTIPKELMFAAMEEIKKVIQTKNTDVGDVIIKNLLNTGVDVTATGSI